MATFRSFPGLRYDAGVVGDPAAVTAPPYDVIDGAQRDRLYAQSDYNVVRIDLCRDPDPYGGAAATLAAWREEGAVAVDANPSLYLYAQKFPLPDGSTRDRVGVIGALRVESFESGKVRPHERTLQKAKDDRFALLQATGVSLSPIFGLVSAPGLDLAALVPTTRPPDVDVRGKDGSHDRMWRLDDPRVIAEIEARVAPHEVFIADGHHRYETALRYRDERRAAAGAGAPPLGEAPYDYVLCYLTTMENAGLVIFPTHRVLATLPLVPEALRGALAEHFTVEELPWSEDGLAAMLRRLDAAAGDRTSDRAHLGVAVRGATQLWFCTAPTHALPFATTVPPALRVLDVTVLHQIVLAGILRLPIGERGGAPGLTYTQDARRALGLVDRGEAAAAFFLPATSVGDLRAVGLAGLTMPEKSTYFFPKLLTGLVFYCLDD
ncbi:MAG: DUF1015 domain-containing protein [Deltaproteobacteria bacterium]|nr:DUF1015 domain-containing protein [Deltaproteobacteria bacterium]